jgi:hypothetical protein
MPPTFQNKVEDIRRQKNEGRRPKPSDCLIDNSILLNVQRRQSLLNKTAELVDENLCGRSEMCMQFAELLCRALVHLQLPARAILGEAAYYKSGKEIFRWQHAWVRVGEEVIDGNVDCLFENPMVPSTVRIASYWGPIDATPRDRRLRPRHRATLDPDSDVSEIWWPEMRKWLESSLMACGPSL